MTLAIFDIYGDDVLEVMMWVLDMEVDKVTKFVTHASGATWWLNFELIKVAPPGGQLSN